MNGAEPLSDFSALVLLGAGAWLCFVGKYCPMSEPLRRRKDRLLIQDGELVEL